MRNILLLKTSHQEIFKGLSNEEAGLLIKGIFDYSNTGNSNLEGYLKIIFSSIKCEIDKTKEKYEKMCKRNQENGRLGGRPTNDIKKNPLGFTENPKKPSGFKEIEKNKEKERSKEKEIKKDKERKSITKVIPERKIAVDTSLLAETTKQVIDYLNKKLGTRYRPTTTLTKQKVSARLNEGYKLDDFIAVIDKKFDDWVGTEYEKYLCPETLFGTKFEKYLNQKPSKTIPNWFNKKNKEKVATEEEQEKFEEKLKQINSS